MQTFLPSAYTAYPVIGPEEGGLLTADQVTNNVPSWGPASTWISYEKRHKPILWVKKKVFFSKMCIFWKKNGQNFKVNDHKKVLTNFDILKTFRSISIIIIFLRSEEKTHAFFKCWTVNLYFTKSKNVPSGKAGTYVQNFCEIFQQCVDYIDDI